MTITAADFDRFTYSTGYLLEMGFSTPIRLCTNRSVTVLGYDWTHGDFTLSDVEEGVIGPQSLKITLGDTNFTYSQTFLTQWTPGITCNIYVIYFLDTVKTEQMFSGELIGPVVGNNMVEITASLAQFGREETPRISFISPYSIQRGKEITVNGTTYVIA